MYYISDILQIKTCFHFFFHTTRTFWNAEPTKPNFDSSVSEQDLFLYPNTFSSTKPPS